MVYLIYGEQYPTIKKKLKLLKKQILGEYVDEFSYVSLSGRTSPVQDIVFEATKPSLFSPSKMIVVTEPYFLTTAREKVDIEKHQDYELKVSYHNFHSSLLPIVLE